MVMTPGFPHQPPELPGVDPSTQDDKFIVALWKLWLSRTTWDFRLGRCLWESIFAWSSKSAWKMLVLLKLR